MRSRPIVSDSAHDAESSTMIDGSELGARVRHATVTLVGMPVERLWWPRLRWRMRGAWQWPAFAAFTVIDGVLLSELPFYDNGTGSVVGGMLLAGFANIIAIAVLAPFVGRRLRRRRPDLPRLVAGDYAGTALLAALAVALLIGGLLHRPAVAAEREELAAVAVVTHEYVMSQEPEYERGLGSIDVLRVEEDLYRSCVPGADPDRWLCMFVTTRQMPPGVTVDTDRAPNSAYRRHGGFR